MHTHHEFGYVLSIFFPSSSIFTMPGRCFSIMCCGSLPFSKESDTKLMSRVLSAVSGFLAMPRNPMVELSLLPIRSTFMMILPLFCSKYMLNPIKSFVSGFCCKQRQTRLKAKINMQDGVIFLFLHTKSPVGS
jgi:hypothetical protein